MILLSESQLDVLISITAFIAVFIVITFFVRFKLNKKNEKVDINKNQDYVIESVLSKHLAKLDKIVSSMGELKSRLDLLEGHSGSNLSDMSSSSSIPMHLPLMTNMHTKRYENHSEFKANISEMVRRDKASDITSQSLVNDKSHKHTVSNNVDSGSYLGTKHSMHKETSVYILKLLQETPKNAREIQYNVGKTREHISRLMKKLHDEGLVDRNMNTKPFTYKITDEGRKLLE